MLVHSGTRRATILIAEDDEDSRQVMRMLLEMHGFGVLEAADGQAALEMARRSPPDLILMDLKMPVLNGLAATRAIRQSGDARLRRVPVVALSAYDPTQHRQVAAAAGCDDYVVKPVDYERLETLIEKLVERAQAVAVGEAAGAKHASGNLAL